MNWRETVVDPMIREGDGQVHLANLFFLLHRLKEHPETWSELGDVLRLLAERLENYPEAFDAIEGSVRDTGEWCLAQAAALEVEKIRRSAAAL